MRSKKKSCRMSWASNNNSSGGGGGGGGAAAAEPQPSTSSNNSGGGGSSSGNNNNTGGSRMASVSQLLGVSHMSPSPIPTTSSSGSSTSRMISAAAAAAANFNNTIRAVRVVDEQNGETYIQLNQYRLMQEIGQGSYGIVKLAYNEQDRNLYALKVLDKMKLLKNYACFRQPPQRRGKATPSTLKNPLQLVQREIAILKKLSHPNVVQLVEVGHFNATWLGEFDEFEVLDDPSDNYLYMVFEYVERGSVLELPTDRPLDEESVWRYFRDTLRGLEYLHYQKIVHRDLKPSNLLLTDTNHVKIADFGVSCEFEGIDAFLTGTAGTPAFMAPEALIEAPDYFYSGRSQDIWSLGITLYAFVYGQVPFWDAYVIALHKKIKTQTVVFPDRPMISDLLKDLILGMLKKDPGLRMMLPEIKKHPWVTRYNQVPMMSEAENCHLVTVTEEEIENCVRVIPRLDTLILVKAMGHRRRFGNPFRTHATTSSLRVRRTASTVKGSSGLLASVACGAAAGGGGHAVADGLSATALGANNSSRANARPGDGTPTSVDDVTRQLAKTNIAGGGGGGGGSGSGGGSGGGRPPPAPAR